MLTSHVQWKPVGVNVGIESSLIQCLVAQTALILT